MQPRVSIILVNWKTWDVTCDCLQSLRKLDYPNYEVIVVDNGSDNDSAVRIESRFPEVTLIRSAVNTGFAGGNNIGIRLALQRSADYVLLLNNDTIASPGVLREMIALAELNPRWGLLCPRIYYFNPYDRIWYAGGTFSLWRGIARHIGLGHRDHPVYEWSRECTFATGCALLARAEFIRCVGGLDEAFFMVCEDTDWCVRALRAGFRIGYVASGTIWHKESHTIRNTAGKWLRDYYGMRNSLLLARKHARWYHWPTLSISLLATAAYRTAGYCVRGELERVKALYRGARDGLKVELSSRLSHQAEPSL